MQRTAALAVTNAKQPKHSTSTRPLAATEAVSSNVKRILATATTIPPMVASNRCVLMPNTAGLATILALHQTYASRAAAAKNNATGKPVAAMVAVACVANAPLAKTAMPWAMLAYPSSITLAAQTAHAKAISTSSLTTKSLPVAVRGTCLAFTTTKDLTVAGPLATRARIAWVLTVTSKTSVPRAGTSAWAKTTSKAEPLWVAATSWKASIPAFYASS